MVELSAFVLAGGKSTRMGADKAFIQLQGRALLARVLDLAHTVTSAVWIVGADDKFGAYGPTVQDIFPERGPLGGIHAALSATTTDLNLILAVDAPFIRPEFLRYLIEQAQHTQAQVTVPKLALTPAEQQLTAGAKSMPSQTQPGARAKHFRSEFHPLCAVYRRAFRERAAAALRAGHNKIDPLFSANDIRIITAEEVAVLSLPPSMFANINTPEDFEHASAHSKTVRD